MGMRFFVAIVSLIFLSACAGVPAAGPYWVKTWAGASEPAHVFEVSASPWGPGVKGWTACDKAAGRCQILIVAGADRDCVLEHERRHVAGWDHPSYPRAFICP